MIWHKYFVETMGAVQMQLPVIFDRDPMTSYFSQGFQDRWIAEVAMPGVTGGFFVELGAGDGVLISNTYFLEKERAWTGVLIEPSRTFEQLKSNRAATCLNYCVGPYCGTKYLYEIHGPNYIDQNPDNCLLSITLSSTSLNEAEIEGDKLVPERARAASGKSQFVTRQVEMLTLAQALQTANAPTDIDFLSLDVEGYEHEVLKAFPFNNYTFKTMIIERPNSALLDLLKFNGYQIVGASHIGDVFFVHSTFYHQYISNLHNFIMAPPHY